MDTNSLNEAITSFMSTWVGLFRLQLDFKIQVSQKGIEKKKVFEMYFEWNFSPFKDSNFNFFATRRICTRGG